MGTIFFPFKYIPNEVLCQHYQKKNSKWINKKVASSAKSAHAYQASFTRASSSLNSTKERNVDNMMET